MGIASLRELLSEALGGGWCLGYFEAWDQYSLETCLEAAEEARAPAIIGFGAAMAEQAWLERRGIELLGAAARRLAETARVPCAVLFNEGRSLEQVRRALAVGCNAVMLDSSLLPYEENLEVTRQVVSLARSAEADVEAEIGRLADGRSPGADRGEPTDPGEAGRFVRATGVSCLAVSAGGAHALLDGEVSLDLERIGAVRAATGIPLALHGGTSIPDAVVAAAAARGVAKINFGTRLKQLFLQGLQGSLEATAADTDVHRLIGSHGSGDVMTRGLDSMRREIVRLLAVYGASGRSP